MKTSTVFAAIAATVCVMTSPLAAEVAALSVTVSGNDVSVSVPAGVLDETSGIYLVWDTDDHGSNVENWPAANRIAYSGSPAVSSAASPSAEGMFVSSNTDTRKYGIICGVKRQR